MAEPTAERKVFHDSVVPIPVQPGLAPNGLMVQPAASEHRDETTTLHFSLALPPEVEAELEAKVARGETVPLEALHRDYRAKQADAEALIAWLKAEGFDIKDEDVSPDHTSIYATAPVAQIEKSLNVNMVRVTYGGFTYTAARNAPSLLVEVGAAVQEIGGLQPFHRAHKHGKRRPPHRGNRVGLGLVHEAMPTPAPNIANAPPYLVSEVLKAYNADGLNVTGNGQTITILIDTFPTDTDLQGFWQRNNLPVNLTRISKINVKGALSPHQRARRRSTSSGRAGSRRARRSASTRAVRSRSWTSIARSTASSRTFPPSRGCGSCRSASGSARRT